MASINSTSTIFSRTTAPYNIFSPLQIVPEPNRIQRVTATNLFSIDYKTKDTDSFNKYSWSLLHQINFKKGESLNNYISLGDLSDHLKRNATADELLNVHLAKEPHEKIDENDPDIRVRDLINWKTLKTFPSLNFPLNRAVTWIELKNHLNKDPTPLQHLNCIHGCKRSELNNGSSLSVDPLINTLKKRDPSTVPTLKEIAEYYASPHVTIDILRKYLNREPTFNEIFNWIEDRDLNHPIDLAEFGNHKWKVHINRCLGDYDWHRPVSFEYFKWLFPNAKWQEHLKCNGEKPLHYQITLQDVDAYLQENKIPALQGYLNCALGRDLRYPRTPKDGDNRFWRIILNLSLKRPMDACVAQFELETILGRTITPTEYINCCWFRALSHPVSPQELEIWLNRPPTLTERINFRVGKDLTLGQNLPPREHYQLLFREDPGTGIEMSRLMKYLNKGDPTIAERINWGLNRNLETPLSDGELGNYIQKAFTKRKP